MVPRVTIIMPAFNTAAYIGDAVRSVLRQTLTNLELVIVDDGSTDGTVSVALAAAANDSRVRLIRQAHGGVSRARNLVMSVANAPVFALLDSDDEWMPAFLETGIGILDANPDLSVVTTNALNRGGRWDGQPYWSQTRGVRRISRAQMIECEDSICIMSLYRREVFEAIGNFDETLSGNEDYDFWLRAAQAGFNFVQNLEPLGCYRRRPDSLSANEHEMLLRIVSVFQKAGRMTLPPAELAAVNRQIARFERELLALEGKAALRSGRFRTAADRFRALYRRGGGTEWVMMATLARYAPLPMLWFDRIRQSLRRRRINSSA